MGIVTDIITTELNIIPIIPTITTLHIIHTAGTLHTLNLMVIETSLHLTGQEENLQI